MNNKLTEEKVGRAEALVAQGEALILTCPENIRYLCSFEYTDGYAIIMHDRSVVFADSRYIEAARAKIAQPLETVLLDRGLGTAEPILRDGKVKRLFYEDIYMTCAELERWKKQYPACTFEPIRGSFDALREVKTPDEVALIESALRAGMLCSEADGIARKIIDDAGYGKCFGHSLGHGVGLFIHEAPNLSPHAGERRLHPGNIVTVEPGIYIEGRCGVRIEDMALIEEGGARILTSCPKELIELCV